MCLWYYVFNPVSLKITFTFDSAPRDLRPTLFSAGTCVNAAKQKRKCVEGGRVDLYVVNMIFMKFTEVRILSQKCNNHYYTIPFFLNRDHSCTLIF